MAHHSMCDGNDCDVYGCKRPRASKTRSRTFDRMRGQIASAYLHAVKTHEPITVTFKRCLDAIDEVDVTATQRKTLQDALWATREFVVAEHARWQLYIKTPDDTDGLPIARNWASRRNVTHYRGVCWTPLTSDEISALREAGDEHVWSRVHGRMEWRDSQKPFYEDEPPQPLSTPQAAPKNGERPCTNCGATLGYETATDRYERCRSCGA